MTTKIPCCLRITATLAATLALAIPAGATDIDGPDDCQRPLRDFGDAPEGFDAYAGILGHFPTCRFGFLPGTQELACPPISTAPGVTGFVQHLSPEGGYWLGCPPAGGAAMGIDSEGDGKTSPGAATSFCADIPIDCFEPTVAGVFGQDECLAGSDAGLDVLPVLQVCLPATVDFDAYNCGPDREVFLNILVDMNRDGDWNDNFLCPDGCAYEWAVKNVLIVLPFGCTTFTSPAFLVGPSAGPAWMRISLSDNPATDDYPWAGSALLATEAMDRGETEDYLVEIKEEADPCQEEIREFGDAPETIPAYPSGVAGAFPTCRTAGPVATQGIDPRCALPVPPAPGPAGYVEHLKVAGDPRAFWIGCLPAVPGFLDSEPDGKVNATPPAGMPSACDGITPTDCVAALPGLAFGQDECFGDGVDAGLQSQPVFDRCDVRPIRLALFNCFDQPIEVWVNVLVDWNEDGDWTDAHFCLHRKACAPEWAVQNVSVLLPPGCSLWDSPPIQVGPFEGFGWMRVTVSEQPAPPDFPWNGTVSLPGGVFTAGETEDYPVVIQPSAVGVEIEERDREGLWLARITPNPTSTGAAIRFGLTRAGQVRVTVYDVAGRRVRTLVDDARSAGAHRVPWDLRNERGEDVAPGIYLVRLEAEDRVLTSRVTRIR